MEIEIEDNIPIPAIRYGGREGIYPFRNLEIGQSFWIAKKQTNAAAAAGEWGKRHSRKFTTRLETKDGIKGTRVWRVE